MLKHLRNVHKVFESKVAKQGHCQSRHEQSVLVNGSQLFNPIKSLPNRRRNHKSVISQACEQSRHEPQDFTFKTPFTMIISGATSSGKTTWIRKLLNMKDQYIIPNVHRIVYCYKIWQADLR